MSLKAQASPPASTKQRLLDAALKLMLAQGYTATSVEEICNEAGVTKGSFFHYFKDKETLAQATCGHYMEQQQAMFAGADFQKLTDPLERIFARFDFLRAMIHSPQFPRSCLIGNFAQELAASNEDIRELCCCSLSQGAEAFARDMAAAKKLYAPDADFDPASLGRMFMAIVQGSMIMGKALNSVTPFEENMGHFRSYVETLFGRKARPARAK